MADTNAIQIGAPVQRSISNRVLGQGGLQGGGGAQFQGINPAPADNSTFELVMKLGESILAPAMAKKQSEVFLEGARRVAQGEALGDIVEEQPWYTKIFGESASVQGARTVAQTTQVDRFNSELMDNMEELQQVGPEEIGKIVNQKMKDLLTGDPIADAVIQQKMVESTGRFYTAHAKNHYKYVQSDMQAKVTDRVIGAAGLLQRGAKQYRDGVINDKDWQELQVTTAQSLAPIQGQSTQSYWDAIETAGVDALVQGNHHFFTMLEETGILAEAPPETRKELMDQRRKYEAVTRETEGYWQYGPQIAQLKAAASTGQISPAEIATQVERMNAEFAALTGIKEPLFQRSEMESMLTGNYTALFKAQEAARKEQASAQADLQAKALTNERLVAMVTAGEMGMAKTIGLGTEAEVQQAAAQTVFGQMQAGGDWAGTIVRNFNQNRGAVIDDVARYIQTGINTATGSDVHPGEPLDQAYAMWKQIKDSPAGATAAFKYAGNDAQATRMENYDRYINAKIDPLKAYEMAFKSELIKPARLSKDETSKLYDSHIKKLTDQPGMISSWLGTNRLSPQGREILEHQAAPLLSALRANGVPEERAAKIAFEDAAGKVDTLGYFAYRKPAGAADLHELVAEDESTTAERFNQVLATKLRSMGVEHNLGRSWGEWAKDTATYSGIDAVADVWGLFTSKDDTVKPTILRGPDMIDEKGTPYTQLVVEMTVNGETITTVVDSRDLRAENFK